MARGAVPGRAAPRRRGSRASRRASSPRARMRSTGSPSSNEARRRSARRSALGGMLERRARSIDRTRAGRAPRASGSVSTWKRGSTPRLHRPLVEEVVAESVDGADARLLEARHRVVQAVAPLRAGRAPPAAPPRASARRRSLSSPAAFSVNVTATTLWSCAAPVGEHRDQPRHELASSCPCPRPPRPPCSRRARSRICSRAAWSASGVTASSAQAPAGPRARAGPSS